MRVVLLPMAPGALMAHVGTCMAVARVLVDRGHEVTIAYGGTRPDFVAAPGVAVVAVDDLGRDRTDTGTIGDFFPDPEDCARRSEADAEVIRAARADVAIVDARPTAQLGAEVAGVPDLAIHHFVAALGHATTTGTRARARSALRHPVYAAARLPLVLRGDQHGARPLHEKVQAARGLLGLPPGGPVFAGNHVACTTTPLLDPPRDLPPTWRYVGPITWSAARPDGEATPIRRGERPLVYVSQGSSGDGELLRRVVRELRDEPVDVLVTTSDRCTPEELEALATNVRAARVLPTDACLAAADVAVVAGGHLTTCAAHRAGVPVVVLPALADHLVWADRVEWLGTGVGVREPRPPGAIRRAVRRVLRDGRRAERAAELGRHLDEWDGAQRTADFAEEIAAG